MATMEDVARLRLEILGDQAEQTVESLKSGLKDVNAELKLLEVNGQKGSEEWRELKRVQADIKDGLKDLNQNIDLNNASWNELNNVARRLRGELGNLKIGSEEWIDKLKQISEVDSKIEGTRDEMQKLKGEGEDQTGFWTTFKGNFAAAFTFEVVKDAARAVFDFGMEVFEMTGKFQRYDAILTNSLGSQEEAAKAMADIKKMAAETPFSVDELTDSYIKYVNRGLQPSMAEMTKLGDIAASQGKSFEQLTEAVLDAGTGEFERLKEFGIQASKSGDEVELSFKGIHKTVGNTPEAIQGAILAFGELEGVQDSMSIISGTLEGKVSNLGDTYDSIKVTLGEFLMPVFTLFLDSIKDGLDWIQKLIDGNVGVSDTGAFLSSIINGLRNVFNTLWDVLVNVVEVVGNVIGSFFKYLDSTTELYGGTNALTWAMDGLRFALNVVGTVIIGALTAVGALIDGFELLVNVGKKTANFFGADFKIDEKALSFDNMAKNAEENFSKIKNLWVNTANDGATAQKKAVDDSTNHHANAGKKQTSNDKTEKDKQKSAADKLAEDQLKANEASLKKQKENLIAAIADEHQRKVASEKFKYEEEVKRIKNSKAEEKNKAKELESLEKLHTAALLKIDKDYLASLKKEEDKKKAEDDKAAKKEADDKKKANDAELKGKKALFTAEFQAFTAGKNLEMGLQATTTARKIALITEENEWRKKKLQEEAAAQKAKIAEETKDEITRAATFKAIDEKLAADLKASDAKLQADKTKQLADANKARLENQDQFFKGLNGLAQGDYTAFMSFLDKKVKAEATANQQRLKDFSAKGVETLAVAGQVVQSLQLLSNKYTEFRLAQIEKEKQGQLKSWKSQYDSGKISKDKYDEEIAKANKKAAEDEHKAKVKAWKRDQTMQIAMAVINGAMAALKSLATMGFPLGLIGVAASAVMTGIQIGIIKGQKPPEAPSFKSGGYVRNAGVPQGGRHGSSYGESGIALWDRKTGQEVGEMEGGEPIMILSRNTYENNGDLIDKLHDSSLNRNGARIFANGGYLNYLEPLQYGESYLFGSKKRKEARAAEAANAANMVPDTEGMDSESAAAAGDSQAAIAESQKVMDNIDDNTAATAEVLEAISKTLEEANGILTEIKNKPNGISLHDLQSALASATSAAKKSNL